MVRLRLARSERSRLLPNVPGSDATVDDEEHP